MSNLNNEVLNEAQSFVIVLYHKENSGLLEHFENNWKRKIEHERDEEGELIEIIRGVHPKVAAVEFNSVTITKGAEEVKIYANRKRDIPLFTLQGLKARQLQVLEDYTKGLLKRTR